ncbi:MAG: putative ABC exporter domain-containing protein [Oscillospiraceae bacterium]|nr:putative ABC exporter domain-containing protein [Oscillospiraceae bacterium]
MRLFGYYALHSFLNQLKKIFKTWVLVFILVCALFGGLIGYGAARIAQTAEENAPQEQTEEQKEDKPSFFEKNGVDGMEMVELIGGFVILGILAYEALSADKNGGKLFLPADVTLLFASPMKPQSVLLFRLMTQLGTSVFLAVYLMLQIPNLMNAGLSLWGSIAAILSFCLTILVGKFLQVLLYLLCSAHPKLKGNLQRIIYALLGLVFAAFFFSWKTRGGEWINAAVDFFCAPATRFVPVWGWLKGFFMFASENNTGGMLLCLALIVLTVAALTWANSAVKADFYEDAMTKSEEVAELLATAERQREGGTAFKKRKKDRSEKLRRDSMTHGEGANVFFFKSLYNRFRFAHFGIFTKTAEAYLFSAVGVWALCRFVFETDPALPSVLTLAVAAFFRALGNPLDEDTKMGFFILIPESMSSKLFYSLLGGTVNCALDMLPALIAVVLLTGMNPLLALGWLLFAVSVDFYSTTVGVFIGLSVPVAAGKNVKQLVQIMFVYFGLLPDIAIMAIGIAMKHTLLAAIAAAVLNVLLGLIFFALSPQFLEPRGGKKIRS